MTDTEFRFVTMLRNRTLLPVLLVAFVVCSVLVLHFFLIRTQRNMHAISTTRVMDELQRIVSNKNEEAHSLSVAEDRFRLYDGVETFVLFIGYPRSSHSLVGAILDAHPEIVIPHEFNLLNVWSRFRKIGDENLQKYLLFYELQQLSTKQALFGIRANNSLYQGESAYTYNVPELWQGGYHKRIKVIGDKKGGATSSLLREPDKLSILEEISDVVKVPMKFIHVTRNPFDNIATMLLRALYVRDNVRGDDAEKVNNPKRLEVMIKNYFELADANQRVRERYRDAVLDIPGHETVLRPRETIKKLCNHLGVTCSEDYLQKCSKIMYGTPSITRNKIVWTEELKSRVTELIKNYPFLEHYSFDEYPK